MHEMNLFKRVSETGKISVLDDERMQREFEVRIPGEMIRALQDMRGEADCAQVQSEINQVFTPERRAKMLALTGVTPLGIPATYYRFMPRKQLHRFLEQRAHMPQDYVEDQENVREDVLHEYLNEYYNEILLRENHDSKTCRERNEKFVDLRLEEKMTMVFPEVPRSAIEQLLHQADTGAVQKFLDQHVDNDYKRITHTVGGHGLVLSNMLSASAGGPVIAEFGARANEVYVEFIAPDDCVITHSRYIEEMTDPNTEKEVFFKKIPLAWVTRIFVDKKTLFHEIVQSPDSAVMKYAAQNSDASRRGLDPYKTWLKNARTRDMLPISLAARYRT